jgi:hypothetical protein
MKNTIKFLIVEIFVFIKKLLTIRGSPLSSNVRVGLK